MQGLDQFIKALEEVTGKSLVSRIEIIPNKIHLFKTVSIHLYVITKEGETSKTTMTHTLSGIYRIENDEDKEKALNDMLEKFMVIMLKHIKKCNIDEII